MVVSIQFFYLAVAMKSATLAVFSSIFLFLALAYTRIFHKIRKDQDQSLMLLMLGAALFGFLQNTGSLMTIGLASNEGLACEPVSRLTNFCSSAFRALVFSFLKRKASLVQYSENASKWTFRLMDFLIIVYFLFALLTSQIDFTYGQMLVPGISGRFCYFTYHPWTTSTVLFLDVVLNLIAVYLFSKPLRSHLKEMKNNAQPAGASNTTALATVIRRNFKGSITSILTSFVVLLFVSGSSSLSDYGIVLTILSFYHIDNAVSLCCLLYVCHNAWDFPESWKRFTTSEKAHTSTGEKAHVSTAGTVV